MAAFYACAQTDAQPVDRNRGSSSYILNCGDNAALESLQAAFEVEVSQNSIKSLRLTSFRIPLDSNLLQPDIIELTQFPDRIEARLGNASARLSLRLANGDRVESMTLAWDESMLEGQSKLEVTVTSEFEIVDQALSRLLNRHRSGQASSLGRDVFRRKPILRELMKEMAMDKLDWRDTVHGAMQQRQSAAVDLSGDLALLIPYCQHCHGDDSQHPPGFLSGNNPLARVEQCAPRMLRRLQAWQASSPFPRSPMPPPASIEFSGVSASDWPLGDHYRKLVASIENLVIQQQGSQRLDSWRQSDYDRLPPCLVDANEL